MENSERDGNTRPPHLPLEKFVCRSGSNRNLECQVHESRQIGSGQTGDGKSDHQHFRYQQLKWTGMGIFNSDDHPIYCCGQASLRKNGVAITVNKRVQNSVLEYNLKNDKMIPDCFQGKSFSITVLQVYAPTSNTEEAEVERFYEDLQDLLELIPPQKKM